MARVMRAVINDQQHRWRESGRQNCLHPIGPGLESSVCHAPHIGRIRTNAKGKGMLPVANPRRPGHNRRMNRRPARPRAYAPDPAAPGRCCDMPACGAQGEYRAPKSRTELTDYWWFCLEHVRAYNGSWDFYKGMSPAQMEAQLRADTSWQRPSWPLGHIGGQSWDDDVLRDPLRILATGGLNQQRRAPSPTQAPTELREPLATLGIAWPTTLDTVKTRYKELAKLHHPDANGGSRSAEERLKTINLAYAAVRSHLAAEPRLAAAS